MNASSHILSCPNMFLQPTLWTFHLCKVFFDKNKQHLNNAKTSGFTFPLFLLQKSFLWLWRCHWLQWASIGTGNYLWIDLFDFSFCLFSWFYVQATLSQFCVFEECSSVAIITTHQHECWFVRMNRIFTNNRCLFLYPCPFRCMWFERTLILDINYCM